MRHRFITTVALVVLALGIGGAHAADTGHPSPERTLIVDSGEVSGVYYPEAGAVCRMVNKDRPRHGLHCLVEPTAGTAANLAALRSGEAQLAIVQSRALEQAVQGVGPFAKAAFPELRSLLSLHGETLAVVLAPNAKIKTAADLKGKRVNLGHVGTFQRSMAEALLSAEGIAPADLASGFEMDTAKVAQELCRNEIDAAVFTGLHPISEIQDAIDGCGATLLPLKDAAIDKFVKDNPSFVRQVIAEDAYAGLRGKVPTVGLRAVLVTTASLPADDAYEVVRAIFEDVQSFKNMHPLLGELDRKQMAHDALVAPVHEGAERYFRETGLQ